MKVRRPELIVVLLLTMPGCARYLSDNSSAREAGTGVDAAADVSSVADLATGEAGGDTMPADTSADAGPFISCGTEIVLPTIAGVPFSPAIRPGGLALLVQGCDTGACPYYESTRASLQEAYGPWVELSINTNQTDATLFDFQGAERMITTQGSDGARHLAYCDGLTAWPCTEVTFAEGALLNADGPSVAVLDNNLFLALNEGDVNNDGVTIHLATLVDSDDATHWTRRPATAINALGGAPGDPGLSKDGRLIVFEWAPQPGMGSDVYVAFWDVAARDFINPRPIPVLATEEWEQEPEVFTLDAANDEYEIYYRRGTTSGEQVLAYRRCVLRP